MAPGTINLSSGGYRSDIGNLQANSLFEWVWSVYRYWGVVNLSNLGKVNRGQENAKVFHHQ